MSFGPEVRAGVAHRRRPPRAGSLGGWVVGSPSRSGTGASQRTCPGSPLPTSQGGWARRRTSRWMRRGPSQRPRIGPLPPGRLWRSSGRASGCHGRLLGLGLGFARHRRRPVRVGPGGVTYGGDMTPWVRAEPVDAAPSGSSVSGCDCSGVSAGRRSVSRRGRACTGAAAGFVDGLSGSHHPGPWSRGQCDQGVEGQRRRHPAVSPFLPHRVNRATVGATSPLRRVPRRMRGVSDLRPVLPHGVRTLIS
jgi:hypothetical protein